MGSKSQQVPIADLALEVAISTSGFVEVDTTGPPAERIEGMITEVVFPLLEGPSIKTGRSGGVKSLLPKLS